MKEIDFLPEWYKSGRRRQVSYRTQYVALGGIFVVMAVWNFVAGHSLSKATAELSEHALRQAQMQSSAQEFARIESDLVQLRKQAKSITQIDSRIDLAGVLGELSYLISEKVVISKVVLASETFEDQANKNSNAGSVVRAAGAKARSRATLFLGDVRFRVVINGVASGAADVAELICRLEDSPYFCQVVPSFSRNKKMTLAGGLGDDGLQVSEFEITCYLANYKELTGGN
jgi:hypothetical protein